jgi:beta-lactamase class A
VQSLEATLQTLIARHPEATVAVAVRDPDGGHRLDLLSDRLFHAASTMKVPVMIEVYRQADLGRFSLDDSIQVVNAFRSIVDGSPYSMDLGEDSDESIYEQIGRPMSIRDLVYQMITVSSNLATNLLIDYVSADSVQATSERLGTARMQTLRGVEDLKAYERGLSNRATAADLATLLDALRRGTAVSPDADRAMVGVLLDQQFNTLIPAGLPGDVRVAHKTGSITEIHHDAAIVYPLDGPPYVLVVLTEGIADEAVSAALAADIAAAVHAAIRPR